MQCAERCHASAITAAAGMLCPLIADTHTHSDVMAAAMTPRSAMSNMVSHLTDLVNRPRKRPQMHYTTHTSSHRCTARIQSIESNTPPALHTQSKSASTVIDTSPH